MGQIWLAEQNISLTIIGELKATAIQYVKDANEEALDI